MERLKNLGSRYPYYEVFTVRGFETSPLGELRLSVLWRYAQEVSTNHLDFLGIDHAQLMSDGVIFLLTDVSLKIHRLPIKGEKVYVCTCPAGVKGTRLLREVVFLTENMELLCEFQTGWVPVCPTTHKLLRPSAFPHTLPMIENFTPFCDISRRKVGQGEIPVGTREVRVTDLDRNHHLNNTVYLDIIADAIGEEYLHMGIQEVHIKYKNEGKYGDIMTLLKKRHENIITVSGHFSEKVCFVAEIIIKEDEKENKNA